MTDTLKFEAYRLGESAEPLLLHRLDEARQIALGLVQQASKTVCLFSRELEPRLFDQGPFLDAMRQLALRSQYSEIRILLQNNERVVKRGHRLIEVARRLTSRLHIRQAHNDYVDHAENFLLVDDLGYLHWRMATMPEATADFNHPLQVKQYRKFFDEVWELSEPDPELRGLHI